MWNTGLNNIINALDVAINVVNGEDKKLSIMVDTKKSANWKSVIFPWCDNQAEVNKKAFQVTSLKSGNVVAYIFQEYSTNYICYSLNDGSNVWDNKKRLNNGSESTDPLPPHSAIDIVIQGDKIWGWSSPSQNTLAIDVLKEVVSAADVAIGVISHLLGGVVKAKQSSGVK